MGRSAKFYKKPTLRERQSALPGSGRSSSALSSPAASKQRSSAFTNDVTSKKAAAVTASTSRDSSKAQRISQKQKERIDAENAAKPKFGQLKPSSIRAQHEQRRETSDDEEEMMEDDEQGGNSDDEVLKRGPRNRNRKDWGPMPKDMGVDYVKLWDTRAK